MWNARGEPHVPPGKPVWLAAMRRLVRLVAVLVLVAGAACSDDDDDGKATGGTDTETVAGGIGLPSNGEVAWHFIGRIDQDALLAGAPGRTRTYAHGLGNRRSIL